MVRRTGHLACHTREELMHNLDIVFNGGKALHGLAATLEFRLPVIWGIFSLSWALVEIRRWVNAKLYGYVEPGNWNWKHCAELALQLCFTSLTVYAVQSLLIPVGLPLIANFAIIAALNGASVFLPLTMLERKVKNAFEWSTKKAKKGFRMLRNWCWKKNQEKSRREDESEKREPVEACNTGQCKSLSERASSVLVAGGRKVIGWFKSWF
jgi:hypothetical protein